MTSLQEADPRIASIIAAERERQANTLEMIASENHVSQPVLEALGSVLTDKYAEGYPSKRWYEGNDHIDSIEQIAINRAKELFGAEHANVQPHSGSSANLAVYLAALKPGGKIMGMDLAHGGHLSHGRENNASGVYYQAAYYGVRREDERLDMDQIREQVLAERPDLLVCGASAYPRTIDFAAFGRIADEAGIPLLSDIAHIAGLVVGGVHPCPLPYSTFVTTTNHKTLRGPRGGIILCKGEWADRVDAAVFPGLQGGPLEHVIAAKAVAFHEAQKPQFKQYARQIIANAAALAEAISERGWRLITGGTDNHLLLIDLASRDADLTGADASGALARVGIISNRNAIPFDQRPPWKASGIRLGTPALTSREMGPDQMRTIAGWIDDVLTRRDDEATMRRVAGGVRELCEQFPIPDDYHQ